MNLMARLKARARGFWGAGELRILGLNLAAHALVQAVVMQFMPLAYYSRLSLHDGNTYFRIAQNLWPPQPITLLSWHKRILLPVLARLAGVGSMEWAFLLIGIAAASLSAVYFYKIAAHHTEHPFRLAVVYSALPWLFFAAHHGLNEPLLMLFLLAGYCYYLQDRPWAYTACFALAMLSKELAALPVLAMAVLIWRRYGWRRALAFAPAVLPFGAFCLVYGLHWGDCLWCLKESAANPLENSFSLKTGLWWMYETLRTGTRSSANPTVALAYDIANQVLNVALLAAVAVGTVRLRKVSADLALYTAVVAAPLLLLGRNQYMLNSSLGRQFLIASLAILGYDQWVAGGTRGRRVGYWLVVFGLLALGVFWTFLYTTFFLFYKLF